MRNFVEEILSKYIFDCVQHRATILYECFSRKKPSLFKRNNVARIRRRYHARRNVMIFEKNPFLKKKEKKRKKKRMNKQETISKKFSNFF